jgi:hypothetical protein
MTPVTPPPLMTSVWLRTLRHRAQHSVARVLGVAVIGVLISFLFGIWHHPSSVPRFPYKNLHLLKALTDSTGYSTFTLVLTDADDQTFICHGKAKGTVTSNDEEDISIHWANPSDKKDVANSSQCQKAF